LYLVVKKCVCIYNIMFFITHTVGTLVPSSCCKLGISYPAVEKFLFLLINNENDLQVGLGYLVLKLIVFKLVSLFVCIQ